MELRDSILKVLVYFDLFQYPVSKEEIKTFLDQKASENDLVSALEQLRRDQSIFIHDEFYSLHNDYSLIIRRRKGNDHAEHLLAIALHISGFLYRFPYVRGIGISGSLSKNYASEKDDIDFFIITKSNRLWIARTIMHLFKKLTFLAGRQHWYCMNYFVDEEGLQIEEKNIFTAMEIVTLLPMCGNGSMKNFFAANDWAMSYYPNYVFKTEPKKKQRHVSTFKKLTEFFFNNRFGDWLDEYLLELTTKRWNKKEAESRRNAKGNLMGLRTGKHFSKPNPAYLQDRVLQLYKQRIREMEVQARVVSRES